MEINETNRKSGFSRITTRKVLEYNNFVNRNCRAINDKIADNIRLLEMVSEQHLLPMLENIDDEEVSKVKIKNAKTAIGLLNRYVEACHTLAKTNNEVAIAENNTLNNFANKIANAELSETIEDELIEARVVEEARLKNISTSTVDDECDTLTSNNDL
jgi:hypothetical protein